LHFGPNEVCTETPGLALLKDKVFVGTYISKCFKIFLRKTGLEEFSHRTFFHPIGEALKTKLVCNGMEHKNGGQIPSLSSQN
jgi:hypothetical protein